MKNEKETRAWVEHLRQQTEQVGQNLIRENEKLRALALAVEAENTRLQEEVAEARGIVANERELRAHISLLEARVRELEAEAEQERDERTRTVEQLGEIERESQQVSEQYALVMKQNSNLANLYVASYMLHSTLDREAVLSGISQIIINLVGSEHYAILQRDEEQLHVVASLGEPSQQVIPLPHAPQVQLLDPAHDGMHALIPLAIGEHITGAIAIFGLLPQKPALDDADRELFEMLSAHAATALYCASLHERYRAEAHAVS